MNSETRAAWNIIATALLQIVPQQLDREQTIWKLAAAERKWILNLQTWLKWQKWLKLDTR